MNMPVLTSEEKRHMGYVCRLYHGCGVAVVLAASENVPHFAGLVGGALAGQVRACMENPRQ